MSSMERNKGTLKFIAQGEEATNMYANFSEEERYEKYFLNKLDKLYEIIYEVEAETGCSYFAEVIGDIHGTQDLDFHTLHYNGRFGLNEILDIEITRMTSE